MLDDDAQTETELKPQAKIRNCLVCKSSFQSEWSGERVCRRCKTTKLWRGGPTAERERRR